MVKNLRFGNLLIKKKRLQDEIPFLSTKLIGNYVC